MENERHLRERMSAFRSLDTVLTHQLQLSCGNRLHNCLIRQCDGDVVGSVDGPGNVNGDFPRRSMCELSTFRRTSLHVGSSLKFDDQNVRNEQQSQYVNRRIGEFQYGHSRGE